MNKFSLKCIVLLSFVFFICSGLIAQILTLDSAIAIMMKKNYNIQMAKTNSQIAANNYSPGMAGMLPSVSVTAGYSDANNNIHQQYSTGTEITRNGATSKVLTPGVGLNWTLFDGTRMFIAYEQLGLLRDEGIMNVKSAVQVNIASVIEAYYNIVQQKKLLAVIDSTIALYKKEMDIAKQQYQIGTSTKLNYLQAEVGYNAQRSAYLRQQVNVTNATVTLNQLIALPVETSYLVSDSIPIRRGMVYDSLKKNMLAQNPDIKISQMNMKVAANNTRIVNALRLPTLSLGLNYGLSRTENSAGLTLLNQTQGLTGGLTLGWTLYNGNIVNIQKKNALLTEMNAKFQSDLVETQTNAVLLEAYQQYNSNLNILKMDEENLLVAKEAVDVALGQFRVGTGNIVQLEQAQASYQTAGSLVVTDRYNSKLSETQLLQQSGLLVK